MIVGDYEPLWAKSAAAGEDYVTLTTHLSDTLACLEPVLDSIPRAALAAIAERESISVADVAVIARFAAVTHDIGKATPAFQTLDPKMVRAIPTGWDRAKPDDALRHDYAGQAIVKSYLISRFGKRDANAAKRIAQIIGSHHGRQLGRTAENNLGVGDVKQFGSHPGWGDYRIRLLDECAELTGLARFERLPRLGLPSQQVITSLVVMADWIASALLGQNACCQHEASRIEEALADLDLPPTWRPTPRGYDAFSITPWDSQRLVEKVVSAQREPMLTIVEAPMGEGKSEAALVAVEHLVANLGLGGFTFALPTQATTNAMHSRVADWVSPSDVGVHLGHSRSRMRPTSTFLATHPRMYGFTPVSITTIDQTLKSVLRTKYSSLNVGALAGKAVVIDEVHTYDAWTTTYLIRALQWLSAARQPVILMSATLPDAVRVELVRAYGGKRAQLEETSGYPRVTSVSRDGHVNAVSCQPAPRSITTYDLDIIGESQVAFDAAIDMAVSSGANVLVVRNTVARAQSVVEALRSRGVSASIAHSRFTDADRAQIDIDLLQRFGKDAPSRPRGHVVVATQVAEASLDVDFDLLITDLAPIDSILQRAGRVHRHERTRPPGYERPRILVTGYDPDTLEFDYGSQAIYGLFALARTSLALSSHARIEMPDDIPALIKRVYTDDDWPDDFAPLRDDALTELAETKRRKQTGASNYLAPEPTSIATLADMWVSEEADQDDRSVRDIEDTKRAVIVVPGVNGELVYHSDRSVAYVEAASMTKREQYAAIDSSVALPAKLSRFNLVDAGLYDDSGVLVMSGSDISGFCTVIDGIEIFYDASGLSRLSADD